MSRIIKIGSSKKGGASFSLNITSHMLLISLFICGRVCTEHSTEKENSQSEGGCVMYGLCGDLEEFGEQTCRVTHPPRELEEDSIEILKEFCPELIDKYGPNLCCDHEQVLELTKKLAMPRSLLGECPSCFNNFRRSFCEFTCSPHQHKFLNVTQVAATSEEILEMDPWLPKEIVRKVDFFISKKYIEETYQSCKDVVLSETNGSALDILCGPWGSYNCSGERWFDYIGSTSNGYTPFDIIYRPIDVDFSKVVADLVEGLGGDVNEMNGGFEPLDIPTYSCAKAPAGSNKSCSCVDCPASCPPVAQPSPPPPDPEEWTIFGYYGIVVIILILTFGFGVGAYKVWKKADN